MATDSEPKSSTEERKVSRASRPPASGSERPKKKKLKRRIPQTEEELNSPSKQTLGMLGILGIMTIVMWAFARGGCNYHPPKETRTPRKVTTEELAHDPKDAAVELQQRWLTKNFEGALELASGTAALAVKADQAACDAACLASGKKLADTVLTSGVVLEAGPLGATVRVTSVGVPGGTKTNLMHLTRAAPIWKASEVKPDTGEAFVPSAASAEPATSAAPRVSSAVSAAPSTSAAPKPHSPAPAASH
ncbi:MAG: hypothetical protein ABI548_04275 [Polyangiaceae bacterium]